MSYISFIYFWPSDIYSDTLSPLSINYFNTKKILDVLEHGSKNDPSKKIRKGFLNNFYD